LTGAITTPNAIPAGARTVAFNLTVADTVSAGHVAVVPGAGTTVTSSTVNWTTGGAIVANGGVVSLGSGVAERQVTLVVGGPGAAATDAIVDITGYYK
jgi:chitodextrinase